MEKQNGPPKDGEKKSREEVMAERAKKKADAKLKKESAKVNAVNSASDPVKKESPKTNTPNPTSDSTKKQKQNKPQKNGPDAKGKDNAPNPASDANKGQQNKPQKNASEASQSKSHSRPQDLKTQSQSQSYVPKRSAMKTNSPDAEKNLQPSNNFDKDSLPALERGPEYIIANSTNVYAPFKILVAKCESGKIQGINELLMELHHTLIDFLETFTVDDGISYKAGLLESIQPQFSFLTSNGRRQFPLAAGNLVRQFRKQINAHSEDDDAAKIKKELIDWLDMSLELNFRLAEKAISDYTLSKLKSQTDKNILTYGRCPVVEKVILNAKYAGLNVHVYVVDDPAIRSGRILLENLHEAGIPCTYGFISSIGYLMEICSVVLLGCSAILSNGRVVAPRGSGLIALNAQLQNLPVLVAAKTCTFVDKIRLDEHLSTALLTEPLESIGEDLVTALITDLRILPPSSAPAVLKAKKLGSE
ncbi:hypothetical protein FO519_008782 [Halicephalobus sp. NKZ332]|nr:hypothetical protein FO519_008782 [Halicephalobus sp. NKZ332]